MLYLASSPVVAQPISPYLFGQNAWLPNSYGNGALGGKLDQLWPSVQASGTKLVRIGGAKIEEQPPTQAGYLALIDSIRRIGAEPLVQVAYGNNTYTAAQAASLVDYINTTKGRNVRYWSIGNEPNLASATRPVIPVGQVAAYIKLFASAMKARDPSILMVGPDCAYYDDTYYSTLIGGANDITGRDAQGRFYLDIVSFHTYPFDGSQTRQQVIDSPTTGLLVSINDLLMRIATANTQQGRTGGQALQWALTEFNVNYKNPVSNTPEGTGVHSFLNGQFWGQVFGVGMQKGAFSVVPWSVHESNGDRSAYDLGYLDGVTGSARRSGYYHEQLLTTYLKGSYVASSTTQPLVKSVATRDDNTIALAVFNMHQSQTYQAVIRFDNTVATTGTLGIRVNAGLNRELSDPIGSQQTVVYQFSTTGILLRRCQYSLTDYQAGNAPTCNIFACQTARTGLWSDSGTWLGGVVPGAGQEAIINANHTITLTINPVTIRKVTYQGGTLRFNSGGRLQIQPN